MRTPAEILQDRMNQMSFLENLGRVIKEMFDLGKLTRMWIDPITNEVHVA